MITLYILSVFILIYIIGKISMKYNLLFDSINDIIKPLKKYDILQSFVAGIAAILVILVTFFIIGCLFLMFVLGTNI